MSRLVLLLALGSAAAATSAEAQTPSNTGSGNQPEIGGTPQTGGQPAAQGTPAQGNPSIQSSLGPYGDPGGIRDALKQRGVTYSLAYIGEILGNPTGGVRRGVIGEGQLNVEVDIDLKTAVGLDGAALHANGYVIHGHGLSQNDVFNLSTVSGIEALPTTRLYEAWFEQTWLGGKVALRAGQLGADTEYLVSQYAVLFLNSTYGWPNFMAYDLPSGGPGYPLATPGLRLKLAPDAHWSVLAGVFDGDPAGAAFSSVNPQILDRYGTNFRVSDPPLFIGEAAYSYGDKDGKLLPGTLKLGGWRHFGGFAAEIDADSGLQIGSNGGRLQGNDGIYGMVDQMVYRVPGTDDGAVGVFARLSGSPADRNLISFYADAGITGKGVVPGRPDDTLGVSFAYTQISAAARQSDRDMEAALGVPYPLRSNETLFEATYQAEVVPGFTIQPDAQYVIRPGGNIPNPRSATFAPIRDAAVFGLRATIQY